MTKEEIKEQYSMQDILAMYGIQTNRARLARCPFHLGDREPSLKVYAKDFNCFGCGANGDIFTFVQRMDNMTFKEAVAFLGGTHPNTYKEKYEARLKAYRANKKREMIKRQSDQLKARLGANNDVITLYRLYLSILTPLSDLWCDVYNKLQYKLYLHDILNDSR